MAPDRQTLITRRDGHIGTIASGIERNPGRDGDDRSLVQSEEGPADVYQNCLGYCFNFTGHCVVPVEVSKYLWTHIGSKFA